MERYNCVNLQVQTVNCATALAASPTAIPAATTVPTAAVATAPPGSHERRERAESGLSADGLGAGCDVRDHFVARLEIALDQLGRLAVGHAETHADGTQLLVDIQPHLTPGLHLRQRSEQGVNRRGAAGVRR
jgi:hypothetical protein